MSDTKMHSWHGHNPWWTAGRIVLFTILGVIGIAAFALVFGWLVMLLWNWLMPSIFGLGQIGFWQAFGLVILAKLLFGAVGGGGKHGHKGGRHGPPWRRHGHGEGDNPCEKWSRYDEFWRDEGKEAFERYTEKKRGEGQAPPEEKA